MIHTLQIIHNKLLFCCFLENKFENIHEKSTIKAKKNLDTLILYKANQKDTQAEPVENVWLGWSTFYEVNLLQMICNTTETFVQLTFSSIPPMNYIMFNWLIQYCASILHWKHLKIFFFRKLTRLFSNSMQILLRASAAVYWRKNNKKRITENEKKSNFNEIQALSKGY